MPAIADVALEDAAVSPVEFTWEPDRIDGPLATWFEKTRFSGVAAGFSPLTISLTRPSATSKVTKVRCKLVVPYLDADGLVEYSTTFDGTFLLPTASTLQNRKDLTAFIAGLIDGGILETVVREQSSIY